MACAGAALVPADGNQALPGLAREPFCLLQRTDSCMSTTPCSKLRGPPQCPVALSFVISGGKAGASMGRVFFSLEMLTSIPA